jgi:outer membrane receptor for ferrienterochelin and colicin
MKSFIITAFCLLGFAQLSAQMPKEAVPADSTKQPLWIVDGIKMSAKLVSAFDPDLIESIQVFKGDSAIRRYGETARNGVVMVSLKKQSHTNPTSELDELLEVNQSILLVDGVKMNKDGIAISKVMEKIDQEDIESISVIKDGTAVAEYGDRGRKSVIRITTRHAKGK